MYTLSRHNVICKNDVNETEYEFEFVEIVGDRFRYKFKVFNRYKDTLGGDLRSPSAEYDIIVRSTSELNNLYNNPEYAHEFISKEAYGCTFIYFEFQLPDEKHSKPGIGTLYSSFETYADIRKSFPTLARNGIVITSMEEDSNKFDFDNNRPVYIGYCFINDDEDIWWKYEETILKLAKDFSINDKDDE